MLKPASNAMNAVLAKLDAEDAAEAAVLKTAAFRGKRRDLLYTKERNDPLPVIAGALCGIRGGAL